MSGERVAIRYARAFVEVLTDKNALGDADTFLAFCSLVDGNKELKALFANVTVIKADKAAVVKALSAKLGHSTWVANFLVVLAEAGRLNILTEVTTALSARLDELRNIRSVMVTTSVALNEVDLAQFKDMMKKKLGSDIRITNQVDASIIGGAVTRVGSVVYDGSVRAQLNKLRAELVKEN